MTRFQADTDHEMTNEALGQECLSAGVATLIVEPVAPPLAVELDLVPVEEPVTAERPDDEDPLS
jgi:hypothetical protein